jgi:DNA-binding FadR family transcriptional regulator
MLRPAFRIRWAGPAVVLALLAAALSTRAAPPAAGDCGTAAASFGSAAATWYERYRRYLDAVQNGPRDAVADAARALTRATDEIVCTGGALLRCLAALR